jgi:hypothetical protein
MTNKKIPTIIGVLILSIGIAVSLFLLREETISNPKAHTNTIPKDIRISNIIDTSFTVSWITDEKTLGFVKWGKSNTNKTALSSQNTKSYIHWVKIEGLSPSTTYSFKINSEKTEFDNDGIPWEVETGPTLTAKTKPYIISGKIATRKAAIVYVTVSGSSLLSTTTFQDGGWIIPISNARTPTLTSYVSINENSSLLEIFVQAPPEGYATAQIYPKAAKPVPLMILGETYNVKYYSNYNFKNITNNGMKEIPKASIILPKTSTKSSKFNIP